MEIDDCAASTFTDLVAGEGAIGICQLSAPTVVHELGRIFHIAHGNRDPVRAANTEPFWDNPIGVGLTVVIGDTHQLILDATRVREVQQLLTKAFKQLRFETMVGEMGSPKAQRRNRHRQRQGFDLP
ncbi:hypothetical protein D9M68_907410 [compost metagenome]